MTTMRLRKATMADLDLLRYWDTKPHVLEAVGEDAWYDWPVELAQDPPWRDFLIAENEGRPIGMIVIIDPAEEETHYWGDVGPGLRAIDIWIGEEADLGRGFGTQMMTLAFERCFDDSSVTAILIDPAASNTRAIRFYQRLGFRPVESRTFDKEDCLVHRLERPT